MKKKTYLDIISYPSVQQREGIKYPNFERNCLIVAWGLVLALLLYLFH